MRHPWVTAMLLVGGMSAAALANQRATLTGVGDFRVTNVRVFDGERVLRTTQVAVVAGIVRAVGNDLRGWQHLPDVDGTGSTLVPGLIDAHVQVRDAADLRQAIRYGVTTVLDMAATRSSEADLFALRIMAGVATDVSDLRFAGFPATAPGGHGTQFGFSFPTIAAAVDAKPFVAARRAAGANYLKLILNGVRSADSGLQNLDEPRVRALVNAAHETGMLAVAHVETLEDATIAIAAGIDGLVHAWRRGGLSAEMSRRIAKDNVFVMPTTSLLDGSLPEGKASLLADPRFGPVLSNSVKAHLSRLVTLPTTQGDQRANVAARIAAMRSLHADGATIIVGTDASPTASTAQGISVHREMELLLQSGFRPSEVLAAATSRTAEAFRLTDRGRIAPGKRADMLLVRGDPTTDLLAVRDISRIWKAGVAVDRVREGR